MKDSGLKRLRKMRKLTQTQLAEISGVSRPTIVRIEGGSGMSIPTVRMLCKALDCEMSDIVPKDKSSCP